MKLKCDGPLSNFAFNCNLRHYFKEKFATTAQWCEGEQSAALESSNDQVLHDLTLWNK